MIHTTDRDTTETATGTGDTNRTIDTIRKAKTIKTGMITIKTGTGSTTEEDQTSPTPQKSTQSTNHL